MKKLFIAAAFLAIVSCKNENNESFGKPTETTTEATVESAVKTSSPEVLGKEIFEGKGNCFACHQMDQKVVGPSIKEIAQIYKDKNGNIVSFLQEKSEPIVDPSQYEVMKTNFALTKAMSEDELKAIEAYFQSTLE